MVHLCYMSTSSLLYLKSINDTDAVMFSGKVSAYISCQLGVGVGGLSRTRVPSVRVL